MATIRDLLIHRTIHYIQPHQTVLEAAKYMVDCHVGAVPVLDGTTLVGIFSERDIMSKVVARQLDSQTTPVAEVMSTALRTVSPDSSSESHGHDAGPQRATPAGVRRQHAGGLPFAA
jgi:CBS domain-containing protein